MDGGSIAGTVFVVFLILKVAGVITWSWWWVTAPAWIDLAATALLAGVLALFGISMVTVLKRAWRRS